MNGVLVKQMDMGFRHKQMVVSIRVIGKIIKNMVKEKRYIKMVDNMKEIFIMIKDKV